MTRSITSEGLLDCQNARRLKRRLGSYLGPHLVRDLDASPPSIPRQEGIVPVLTALSGDLRDHPHLYEGFVLPLQWDADAESDSDRLPSSLVELAEEVRTHVSPFVDEQGDPQHWRLQPADLLDSVDLSGLELEGTSMWAPLTAGLIMALREGEPKPHVFGTGGWNLDSGDGITAISSLEAKVEAARRACRTLDEATVIGVPEGRPADTVRRHLPEDGEVVAYPRAETDPREIFREHLERLETPPAETAPLQDRCDYVNQSHLGDTRRFRYYRRCLVEDLGDEVQEAIEKDVAPLNVGRLLLTLGTHPQLPLMLLHAFEPDRLGLLGTPRSFDECLDDIRNEARRIGIRFEPGTDCDCFDLRSDDLRGQSERLAEWLAEEPDPGRRFVDLTSGLQSMSATATMAADRSDAHLHYVKVNYNNNRPAFGTERSRFLM